VLNDFIIFCEHKDYDIKEHYANYFLHMSDVTFDMAQNEVEAHHRNAEPFKVTLLDIEFIPTLNREMVRFSGGSHIKNLLGTYS